MDRQSVRVTIKPGSREVWVVSGSTIKEALLAAAVPISMPCGGHGRCGRCVVSVQGGVSAITPEEKRRLPGRGRNVRLACLARILDRATVTVPTSSRVTVQKMASRGTTSGSYRFSPGVTKIFLGKRHAPTLRRLKQDYGISLEDIDLSATDPALMEPALREDHQWRLGLHSNVTAVVTRGEIIGLEAGDTTRECFGAAVDVGTNTVVCSLVNLASGREMGTASTINPQVMHGDDVISRIRFAKTAGGLELLRAEIVNLINGLLEEITGSLGIDRRRIYLVSAVGNTAMQHILAGISPLDLGRAPYRARTVAPVETLAARAGISANRDCRLVMPPVLGGFVGGDLVALVVSQSLAKARRPVLAVDLGTNGEIVLASKGRIAACSTAAGPAFEGERISAGVRAIQGAVEAVRITRQAVNLETIGGGKPVGLCGSGLLGAIAELVRTGVIDPTGRIR
ncbi:MAG: ASKHA domain-containing protein, partial [bacterium]